MNPAEVEYTRKLLGKIGSFFKNEGFAITDQIVDGTKIETLEGTDAIINVGSKLVGIQIKRPYDARYRLKKDQHDKIKERKWVIYAFPEEMSGNELKNILHRRQNQDKWRF